MNIEEYIPSKICRVNYNRPFGGRVGYVISENNSVFTVSISGSIFTFNNNEIGFLEFNEKNLITMKKLYSEYERLANHPWIRRVAGKLEKHDLIFIIKWLACCTYLDKERMGFEANRVFLDNTNKPKNWKHISEICTSIALRR